MRQGNRGRLIWRPLSFQTDHAIAASCKRLHIGEMAKDRILIKPIGWEVFLVQDGRNILLAFAGSEAQAKCYAKQAEVKYGLKKKKKKK
jgi:hypothetical protein